MRRADPNFVGIALCVIVIGYALYLLIDPVGYSNRFLLIVPTQNPAIRKVLRVSAVLVIAFAGFMLNHFVRAAIIHYRY